MALGQLKTVLVCILLAGLATAGTGLAVQQLAIDKPLQANLQTPPKPQDRTAAPSSAKEEKSTRTDRYGDPLPEGAVQRLGTLRFRLPNSWGKPKLCPDGRTFISAVENAVLLCDSTNGRVIKRFPTSRVDAVAISPDGKRLALADANEIRLWDIPRDRQLGQLKVSEAHPLLFRPDGKALAVHKMKMNEQIELWDLGTGRELWKREGPDDKRMSRELIAFSSDGKTLLVQEDRGKTYVFLDANTGQELRRFKGRGSEPVFSPDLKTFAAFQSADWSVHLWNAETGRELHQLQGVTRTGQRYTFSPDSKTLAWGRDQESGGGVSLIEVATGKEIRRLAKKIEYPQFLAYWPNEKTLAFCTWHEKTVRFWDIERDSEIRPSEGHRGQISSVVCSADGRSIISGGMDGMVRRWDLATGKEVQQFKAHRGGLWGMALSPNGKTIATAGLNDKIIRLWDSAAGKEIRQLVGYQDGVDSLAFSPDGKILASGGSHNPNENRLLRFWDVHIGKEIRFAVDPDPVPAESDSIDPGILSVGRVKFSPDGKFLAASCRDNVAIYEAATGRQYRRFFIPKKSKDNFPLSDRKVDDMAFSPDGKTLVSGGSADADGHGSIYLWELASGKVRLSVKTTVGHAVCLALSPDGTFLAAATSNNKMGTPDTVRVLDARSGEILRKFPGHESWLSCLAFSPDGKQLASGSWDTTILIWDVADLPSTQGSQSLKLSTANINQLWSDLASEDAEKAYRSIWKLVSVPQQTVSLIREHLKPAVSMDSDRVSRLIAELDNASFTAREKAFEDLSRLEDLAEPVLRKKLDTHPSLETRRRIETLLGKLHGPITSSDKLRAIRAVEVLEHIATPEAKKLLETLAAGAPEARLTQEAKVALSRLQDKKEPRTQ